MSYILYFLQYTNKWGNIPPFDIFTHNILGCDITLLDISSITLSKDVMSHTFTLSRDVMSHTLMFPAPHNPGMWCHTPWCFLFHTIQGCDVTLLDISCTTLARDMMLQSLIFPVPHYLGIWCHTPWCFLYDTIQGCHVSQLDVSCTTLSKDVMLHSLMFPATHYPGM